VAWVERSCEAYHDEPAIASGGGSMCRAAEPVRAGSLPAFDKFKRSRYTTRVVTRTASSGERSRPSEGAMKRRSAARAARFFTPDGRHSARRTLPTDALRMLNEDVGGRKADRHNPAGRRARAPQTQAEGRHHEHTTDAMALRADEGRGTAPICCGESQAGCDPQISEWGNPPLRRYRVMRRAPGQLKHLSSRRKREPHP
jgi:hypothetical protein